MTVSVGLWGRNPEPAGEGESRRKRLGETRVLTRVQHYAPPTANPVTAARIPDRFRAAPCGTTVLVSAKGLFGTCASFYSLGRFGLRFNQSPLSLRSGFRSRCTSGFAFGLNFWLCARLTSSRVRFPLFLLAFRSAQAHALMRPRNGRARQGSCFPSPLPPHLPSADNGDGRGCAF